MLTTKDWDHLFNSNAGARRVCVDGFWRSFHELNKRDALKDINTETRQRRQARFNQNDIPKAKWRHLGKQSLMDIPVDVPLEKLLYDQTGQIHRRGDPWVCKKCHTKFMMGAPPDICPVCRTPSFIADRTIQLRA